MSVDPSGLWEIDWEDDFTDEERRLIEESLERIAQRMRELLEEIDRQMRSLPPDVRARLDFEISNLREVFEDVLAGIESDDVLDLQRTDDRDWGTPAGSRRGGLWWQPDLIINDAYFDWSKEEEIDRILFHELTHLTNVHNLGGTEDNDSEGYLMNAHTIDDMINRSFENSPIWVWLLNDPERALLEWEVHEPYEAWVDRDGWPHPPIGTVQ